MVLASANETVERRQRLLDRLIELRRILHTLKDSNNSQQESSDGFSHGPPTSIPIPSTGSFTPLIRRVRTGSQHSLTVHGCSPERSRRSKRSASPTRSTGGHEFKLTLAFRYLGQSCEYCRRVIRDPSRRILTCSQCPVVCHPQHCLRGLTRRCPCSLMSSDFYSSLKPLPSIQTKSHTGTDTANPMAPAQFRHLEVHCLCYLGANLTDQCWSCFECRKPLRPAPNSTVAAEPSMVSPFVQTTDCVMESTANLLMRQAASAETNPDAMLKWVTPQLRTQVDSLWDHTAQVLSHHPKFTVPTDDTGPHLQWAYADAQTDLGPIQTWADAVVLEAVHRVSRTDNSSSNPTSISANHLRAPLLLNGEVVKPQSQTDSGSVCPIGNTFEQLDQARLCYYTGQFYCTQCHWGDSHLIPACLFTLGDYRPKPVCRSALLWLRYTWSRHLFRVPDSWYRYEPQAQVVAALRIRLFRCKPYVDSCDQARIVWTELNSHEPYWIFEQPYTFTMELASYVIDGTFAPKLKNYLRTFDEHVRSCPVRFFGNTL
ncbi:unnamed protein product [Echinostoma caproni]|uniref:Phorbol-ester/DAG-type domain-containing protein n=1 Tax=Echinostoma caproni TaxID=27848 RepID=A0A183AIR5_9TREM|nr:unnamed protein product [Echinostoma caproni]